MKLDIRSLPSPLVAALASLPFRLPLGLGLVAVVLLWAAAPGRAAPAARVDDMVREQVEQSGTARVIVKMKEGELGAMGAEARGAAIGRLATRVLAAVPGLKVRHKFTVLPLLAGEVDAAALEALARVPEVEAIYPDRPMHALLNVSGPLVGQPQAEAAGFTGKGIGIAIIDTGVDYLHPGLGGTRTKQFTDVKPGQWAWRAIQAAAENGVVAGYPGNAYKPTTVVKRDQMAVFIARALAGGDAAVQVPTSVVEPSFADVPDTGYGTDGTEPFWAYRHIEYCKGKGIVQGFADGLYHPEREVNRGQMAVFVARAMAGGEVGVAEFTGTPHFPDVTATNDWAAVLKYVEYAAAKGVVQGYPDGKYHPEKLVSRDQMAVFVARAFDLEWSGRVIAGANLQSTQQVDPEDPMDNNGHGTDVAGIAAGEDTTYRGMAPQADIIALKVLDQDGNGLSSDVIRGIEWCIQHQQGLNIRVINLSVGDSQSWANPDAADDTPEGQAVTEAVNAGMLVAAAAGNEAETLGTHGVSLPAAASDAMAVGATRDGGPEPEAQPVDGIASYSDRGELLAIYAPGSVITTLDKGGGYYTGEGTSFATPHVSGAAAVMASMGISDPREIRSRLARTGVQLVDPTTGVATPRLDLTRALDPPAGGPDLVVTAVSTTSTSPIAGDTIPVSVTVKNQGSAASGATTVLVVVSANSVASPQDPPVITAPVPSLAPGETYSPPGLAGVVKATNAGDYWLGAYVDDGYAVAEADETNNSLTGTALTVGLRSARVVSTAIPATMHAGQSYTVSVQMLNDGQEAWATDCGLVPYPAGTAAWWGVTRVALPATVAPGASHQFQFTVTAPTQVGAVPCYWQMAKGDERFGEVATGATKAQVLDSPTVTQASPAVSDSWVAFEDYTSDTRAVIRAKRRSDGTQFTLPDSINPTGGWPSPTFQFFDDPYTDHIAPVLSGNWITWMSYDMPLDPGVYDGYWTYQTNAYDLSSPAGTLPLRVTLQNADALFPDIDGMRVVWEDYRNDPDRMMDVDPNNFLADNPDIYIADLTQIVDATNRRPKEYPLCTAPGPQFAPRISGNLVVWEDWRDLMQGDIYCYDLSADTDGDGIPNWKDSDRPNPDPAERRLTATEWSEQYPDVAGRNVVWMDFRRFLGAEVVDDIYSMNVDTQAVAPVATDPPALRLQPRISGTQVTWEDWRTGLGSVYWYDLATGASAPLAGGFVDAGVPDISGSSVAYVEDRGTTDAGGNGVYNVWVQTLQPYVQVVP